MNETFTKTKTNSVFLANLHHTFAQTDGTYAWPKGIVGDLLKQAKKEIEAHLVCKQRYEKAKRVL